jgi:hypothetical protein
MPEEYKYQEAPAGLSNVGRYLWYSCQMEMYRQSLAPSEKAAEQNMHWTAGIVRRFKQFPVVKFILSRWSDSRQPPVM